MGTAGTYVGSVHYGAAGAVPGGTAIHLLTTVGYVQVPRVVSARAGLMIEGGATLPGAGIIYRAVLLPLSEGSVAIDHVLGAMNYRSLRPDEVRSTEVNFRRLPTSRIR